MKDLLFYLYIFKPRFDRPYREKEKLSKGTNMCNKKPHQAFAGEIRDSKLGEDFKE